MESLTQENVPINLDLLNKVALSARDGDNVAHGIICDFLKRSDCWKFTEQVLNSNSSDYAKMIACEGLKQFIDHYWKTESQEARFYIFQYIKQIALFGTESHFSKELLTYINKCLIHMLLLEWPQMDPNFLEDLFNASKTSLAAAENDLTILVLLCQQIFDENLESFVQNSRLDYLSGIVGQNAEFIFNFIFPFIKDGSQIQESLIFSALSILHYIIRFTPWEVISENGLFDLIISNYLSPKFLHTTLFIISDIFLDQNLPKQFTSTVPGLYSHVIKHLSTIIPDSFKAFEECPLIKSVNSISRSLCFTLYVFLDKWGQTIENSNIDPEEIQLGIKWMLYLTSIDPENNLHTCTDFWLDTVGRIHSTGKSRAYDLYSIHFPELRRLMIQLMPRPKEVLVELDSNDELRYATEEDTISTSINVTMIQILKYLTKINIDDTLRALSDQFAYSISENNLRLYSSACYSMAALSGIISSDMENSFVTSIVQNQISVSAEVTDINTKMILITGMMFVCSSLNRFLASNPDFLNVIIEKLFSFMETCIIGVQAMAISSFSNITSQMRIARLLVKQCNGQPPMIVKIVNHISEITPHLSPSLVSSLYKASASVLSSSPNSADRENGLEVLLNPINTQLENIIQNIGNINDNSHMLILIMKCNAAIASVTSTYYDNQMEMIFQSIMKLYPVYLEPLKALAGDQSINSKDERLLLYKSVLASMWDVLTAYFTSIDDKHAMSVCEKYVEPILPIFQTFPESSERARIPEIICFAEVFFQRLGKSKSLEYSIPSLYSIIFETTAKMISNDFDVFPDFRLPFYSFIKSMVSNFSYMLSLSSPEQFSVLVDSIMFGIQHPQHAICLKSLEATSELLKQMKELGDKKWGQFLGQYFMILIKELFVCLTDTVHKFAFDQEIDILMILFKEIPNQEIIQQIIGMLIELFSNHDANAIAECVTQLVASFDNKVAFREAIRDFLVMTRHFEKYEPELNKLENSNQDFVEFINPNQADFLS